MYKYTPQVSGESTFGLNYQPSIMGRKQAAQGAAHIDYDAERIINSHTALPPGREYLIYKFITELKADLGIINMTDMFDCFYMFATAKDTDSYINWAQPGTYSITLIGTTGSGTQQIQFQPNIGWYSNSISNAASALNTNFNPYGLTGINFFNHSTTNGTNSIYNAEGSIGLYCTEKGKTLGGQNIYELGAATSGGNGVLISVYNSANSITAGLMQVNTMNMLSSSGFAQSGQSHHGLYTFIRKYGQMEAYWNGDIFQKNTNTTPVFAYNDRGPITICVPNINSTGGTATNLTNALASTKQISFVYIGSSLIKPDIIYKRVKEYLDNTGTYNPLFNTQVV